MRVNLSLTRWPCHGTPTQEVQVSVEYALTCRFSGVKNCSVAIEAALLGDLIGGQEKVGGDGRAIAGNPGSIFSMQSWDYQNMGWCLRIQVVESDNVVIAENNIGRDFTFDDLAKNAVGI